MEQPKLGQLIADPAGRDAVHVAVLPAVAGEALKPGTWVAIKDGKAVWSSDPVGIVDPFLRTPAVKPGETFYVLLTPGTITTLRHVWQHPRLGDEEATAHA